MESDAELLYGWRDGSRDAGQALFRRYYAPLARFFANKLQESPADLVQETLMACVKGRDRIREGSSFRSYLFAVAYRVLSNHLRQRYAAPDDPSTTSVIDLHPGPSTVLHRSEETKLLLRALRSLPLELQVLIELRYWERMTSAEIADALGIPAGTVRWRLSQGREELEGILRSLPADPGAIASTLDDLDGWAQRVRENLGIQKTG